MTEMLIHKNKNKERARGGSGCANLWRAFHRSISLQDIHRRAQKRYTVGTMQYDMHREARLSPTLGSARVL